MKNNLDKKIEEINKKNKIGIMAHLVTGYPTLTLSKKIAETLIKGGADIIEIQIPFSDPMADGRLIVGACQSALQNGTCIEDSFRLARHITENLKVPVVLMTYSNILIHMGIKDFCISSKRSGVSGLIVPDLPYDSEECKVLQKYASLSGIHIIYVISPAIEDKRLKDIQRLASGFLYCTSRQGTTGAGGEFRKNINSYLAKIANSSSIPLAVGFGISSAKDLKFIEKYVQIGVIGSAIVKVINKHENSEILSAIAKFMSKLREH